MHDWKQYRANLFAVEMLSTQQLSMDRRDLIHLHRLNNWTTWSKLKFTHRKINEREDEKLTISRITQRVSTSRWRSDFIPLILVVTQSTVSYLQVTIERDRLLWLAGRFFTFILVVSWQSRLCDEKKEDTASICRCLLCFSRLVSLAPCVDTGTLLVNRTVSCEQSTLEGRKRRRSEKKRSNRKRKCTQVTRKEK